MQSFLLSGLLPFAWALDSHKRSDLPIDHIIALSTVVPGLLLFEDFYGRGWRDSVRWLIGIYCTVAAFATIGIAHLHHSGLILPPGTVLVISVPIVLAVGDIAGYRPPPLPHRRILFAGLISFFCAYSVDRLRHRQFGNWHAGEARHHKDSEFGLFGDVWQSHSIAILYRRKPLR